MERSIGIKSCIAKIKKVFNFETTLCEVFSFASSWNFTTVLNNCESDERFKISLTRNDQLTF